MADRTVNVNIRYNINTAEVQRVVAASQAAQKATDELRKSVEQYGKASTAAHREAAKATREASQSFGELYNSVKLVLAAGIVKEITEAAIGMSTLAGRVQGVTTAFNRLPNSTVLLNDLRKATHGVVSDLELMQRALSANNFRIPLEKLGTLLEFAAVKAQQTGQEVNHLVDYIVSGIGYRSIKRLDDLGFTANRVKEALGGVSLQAATMGEVMEAVTKLMNEDLQKTGGYVETSETEVGRLNVAWKQFKETLSQSFAGTISNAVVANLKGMAEAASDTVKVIDSIIEAIKTANPSAFRSFSDLIAERQKKEAAIITANEFMQRRLIGTREENIKVIEEEIQALTHDLGIYAKQRDAAETTIKSLREMAANGQMNVYVVRDLVNNQKKYIESKREDAIIDQDVLRILSDKLVALRLENATETQSMGIIEAKRQQIEDLQDQIEKTTSMPQLKQLNRDLELAQAQLKDLLSPLSDSAQRAVTDKDKGLTQTVNFDFKDPLTGEIKKLDVNNIIKSFEGLINATKGSIPPINQPVQITKMDDWDKISEMWSENWRDVLEQGIGDSNNFFMGLQDAEIESYRNRLDALRNFYDEQQILAGNNERYKDELRLKEERETTKLQRELALKEWQAKRNSIILSTAGGIARAFIDYQWPYALIPAAAVAFQGATQLSIADRNKPRFAKGVIDLKGPGSETSDSIDAKLSRGESVMTAKETRESFGILTDIRTGKINDKILQQIVMNGGSQSFDDSRIISAINNQPKPPDIVKQGRQIYEVHKLKDGNKRFIRSKSI